MLSKLLVTTIISQDTVSPQSAWQKTCRTISADACQRWSFHKWHIILLHEIILMKFGRHTEKDFIFSMVHLDFTPNY